jgi:hypothetical protein
MIRKLAMSLAMIGLLAACNPNAAPQANISSADREQLEGLMRSYLDSATQANAQGFTAAPGANDEIAALQPDADHRWDVNLAAGTSYRILGVCDNECSNVDMELIDGSGAVVQSDVLPDDIPIVNITPAAAGRYSVRMVMKTCTLAPCYVGGRVLQQQPAPAVVQPVMGTPGK